MSYKVVVNHSNKSASIEVGTSFIQTFNLSVASDRMMFEESIQALQLLGRKSTTLSVIDGGNSIQIEKA